RIGIGPETNSNLSCWTRALLMATAILMFSLSMQRPPRKTSLSGSLPAIADRKQQGFTFCRRFGFATPGHGVMEENGRVWRKRQPAGTLQSSKCPERATADGGWCVKVRQN